MDSHMAHSQMVKVVRYSISLECETKTQHCSRLGMGMAGAVRTEYQTTNMTFPFWRRTIFRVHFSLAAVADCALL